MRYIKLMAWDPKIVESLITGLLSGGATAITTTMGVFRDVRARVAKLELSLGQKELEPKTGLMKEVEELKSTVSISQKTLKDISETVETLGKGSPKETRDQLEALKREIANWDINHPEWLRKVLSRQRTSAYDIDEVSTLENRLLEKLKNVSSSIKRLEDRLDELDQPDTGKFLSKSEYIKDSEDRSDEMQKIRQELSTSNSLMRGVMAALGYIDNQKSGR
jgi:DNA repair ATPase RecN